MIIDSWFDNYVGVVMLIRVENGTLKLKDKVRFDEHPRGQRKRSTWACSPAKSVPKPNVKAGEVGYFITGVKELGSAKVGDTITRHRQAWARRAAAGLPRGATASVCRPVPDGKPTITKPCAMRWKSCNSTMLR